MQKILVTGANGFLGYYLVQYLLSKDHFVLATGKGTCRLPFTSPGFEYSEMDFTNGESVREVFLRHQPRVIVHCGAMSKPDECEQNREAAFRTNLTGTLYLLEQAAQLNGYFIFLSTDFVFSGEKAVYKEEDETGPVNYYGETKLLAEEAVRKHRHDWAIVRTALVYGKPFLGRHNILTNSASALRKGERLNIFNDQVRTPTYVEDLAGAIVSLIERKATRVYHISGADIRTPYQMAVAVADHLGLDATLITKVTEKDFQQPARRPPRTVFDISKAKKELGYEPVSFDEGLRRTFA
jgi:dTDP-4-dehydrorhamnose reductase